MEQGEAGMGDILLLDEEDCESGQRGQEWQLATSTQDESRRSGSLFRWKRKNDTRDVRTESSPRPRKAARRQNNSVSSSDVTVAKDLNTQRGADNVGQSRSRGIARNASSKKGKEKVRDKQTERRSSPRDKRAKGTQKETRWNSLP